MALSAHHSLRVRSNSTSLGLGSQSVTPQNWAKAGNSLTPITCIIPHTVVSSERNDKAYFCYTKMHSSDTCTETSHRRVITPRTTSEMVALLSDGRPRGLRTGTPYLSARCIRSVISDLPVPATGPERAQGAQSCSLWDTARVHTGHLVHTASSYSRRSSLQPSGLLPHNRSPLQSPVMSQPLWVWPLPARRSCRSRDVTE